MNFPINNLSLRTLCILLALVLFIGVVIYQLGQARVGDSQIADEQQATNDFWGSSNVEPGESAGRSYRIGE
ncbi:hypothetical protein BZY95_06920 [Billgrantia desiderata SP1]|uniref:hypothetical protein n=1 Tax=Billgrantia desiderata TaxID=52021 RepID=UPI000A3742FB|nr:hypothetical protein [Halomonas desiderata]OUE43984.1 hypothetical protein BZY95_06920 [Halomonas desiderata SP1]